jgi:hypothetical protein
MRFDDLSAPFVVEVDRETGCYMSSAGGMPERDFMFLYHDNRYHFYFCADQKWERQVFDIVVMDSMSERGTGASPPIQPFDMPVIRKNMEKFFRERWFLDSSKPRPARGELRKVVFSWNQPR